MVMMMMMMKIRKEETQPARNGATKALEEASKNQQTRQESYNIRFRTLPFREVGGPREVLMM